MMLRLNAPVPLSVPRSPPTVASKPSCLPLTGNHVRRSILHPMATLKLSEKTIVRRSANYQPTAWGYDFVQSLTSDYVGGSIIRRVNSLKEKVKTMLEKEVDPLLKLELIDIIQRLGISYHFEDEIETSLKSIHDSVITHKQDCTLYSTALQFRLFRQNGYYVPQEVFNSFRDESGNFKPCLVEDCKGMLQLYEASYLSRDGESILDDARAFAVKHLKEYLKQNRDPFLSTLIGHALELPLHRRMGRMEARWFIDVYEQSPDSNPLLLDFAKLDFNVVQAVHQEDLKHASRWWRKTGLPEKLNFARDRLVENFLWAIGVLYEPQYANYRRMATQVHALLTIIDDIYDVYGTLDELELFTNLVDRWDINGIEDLPEYMKLCFFALYNSINEMASDILRDQGFNILPYTKKMFANACNAYLVEAKWYHSGYKPTVKEYFDNAVESIAMACLFYHAYVLVSNPVTKEALEWITEYPTGILLSCATVARLADDFGTSPDELKRGDAPKTIQCFMNESGVSEKKALEYAKALMEETWKKMNKEMFETCPLPRSHVKTIVNVARAAQFMYLHGDGHSSQDQETKNRVLSLLVDPIEESTHDYD